MSTITGSTVVSQIVTYNRVVCTQSMTQIHEIMYNMMYKHSFTIMHICIHKIMTCVHAHLLQYYSQEPTTT